MMNKLIFQKTFLIISIVLSTVFGNIQALDCLIEESKELENTLNLKFRFDPNDKMLENLKNGNFIQILFDENKLNYKRFDTQGTSKRNFKLDSKNQKNEIRLFLNSRSNLKETEDSKSELDISFKIKNNKFACKTPISIINVDVKNETSETIKYEEFSISGHPDAEKCKLASLSVTDANIPLKFDPDIFNYELTVNHDVDYLYLDATPMTENLKVKINRSKLCSPGKYTDIIVKVSHPTLKIKNVYKIKVFRKQAPVETPKSANLNLNKKYTSNMDNSSNDKNSKDNNETINDEISNQFSPLENTEELLETTEITDEPESIIEVSEKPDETSENSSIYLPAEIFETNENNFRKYLLFTFLIVISLLFIYLAYRNIKSNIKKIENNK